jgi:hypothetical protein
MKDITLYSNVQNVYSLSQHLNIPIHDAISIPSLIRKPLISLNLELWETKKKKFQLQNEHELLNILTYQIFFILL